MSPPQKDTIDRMFRVRKFQYNTYAVRHPDVTGTLRLANIPSNIVERVGDGGQDHDTPEYGVAGQVIMGFSNKGEKKKSAPTPAPAELRGARKKDLTQYVLDNPVEPWNEYVLEGDPPVVVGTRTILAKLEWYVDHTNELGDPLLWASQNTTVRASRSDAADAGLV